MKDVLGREIQVGDFIAISSSNTVSLKTTIVLKLNPSTLATGKGLCKPGDVMIINDQLMASDREDLMVELNEQYSSQFDYTKPKEKSTSKKFSYCVAFLWDTHLKDMVVHIKKLETGSYGVSDRMMDNYLKSIPHCVSDIPTPTKIYRKWSCSYSEGWGNNTKRIPETKLRQSYSFNTELLLKALKYMGLDSYIDQTLPYDQFKSVATNLKLHEMDRLVAAARANI